MTEPAASEPDPRDDERPAGFVGALAAYLDGMTPKVIPSPAGDRLVPSIVSYTTEGAWIAGEAARPPRER